MLEIILPFLSAIHVFAGCFAELIGNLSHDDTALIKLTICARNWIKCFFFAKETNKLH